MPHLCCRLELSVSVFTGNRQ